jgi:hypothetical protein
VNTNGTGSGYTPLPLPDEMKRRERKMYYVEDYYTDEIITTTDDINIAIDISEKTPDSIVTDEEDDVYYTNVIE